MRTRTILSSIALCLTSTIYAQTLPDAPTPHILSADHIAITYDATARILDVVSTNQFLGRGGREVMLPPSIVDHPAIMIGFEAAAMGVEWLGARELRRHGHNKLARMVWMIDGSTTLATDVRNFEIQRAATVASVAAPVTPAAPVVGTPIVKVPRR